MKKLDFRPAKSKEAFRGNYKLHDLAETTGKNLLVQWGFNFKNFGQDRRYEKLWEKGEDTPDAIISYRGKTALLDWKGKHKPGWMVNYRAVKSYEKKQADLKLKTIICFFVFDEKEFVIERRFAIVGKNNYAVSKNKQWDKNTTVEFNEDIPKFTKENLLRALMEN